MLKYAIHRPKLRPARFNISLLLPPAAGLTPPKSASVKWSLRSCWWQLVPGTARTATALLPASAAAAQAGRDPSAESVGAFTSSPLHLYPNPLEPWYLLLVLKGCQSLFGFVFPSLLQLNVSPPAATEGCAWSPTSACARVAILGLSVRRVRGTCPTTRRKTAYWTTSLTWRRTSLTWPAISYRSAQWGVASHRHPKLDTNLPTTTSRL